MGRKSTLGCLIIILLCPLAFAGGYNITGDLKVTGNTGLGYATPNTTLYVNGTTYLTGTLRAVGIGTTTPQELCRKSDGTIGYFNGAWTGSCT